MPDLKRLEANISAAAEAAFAPADTLPAVGPGLSREQRLEQNTINATVRNFQTQGLPDMGERDGPGMLTTGTPTFGAAYKSAYKQSQSTVDYAQALVQDALGFDESARDNVQTAQHRDRINAGLMAGGTSAQDLLDDPSIGGVLQFAKEALGQVAPMALESATGALVGSVLLPGAGTLAGATGGIGIRAMLRMGLRNSIKNIARGQAREIDDKVLSGLLRTRLSKTGALVGAGGVEGIYGGGEAYKETVEAGAPSPWKAALLAVPYTALGLVSDKLAIDTLANVVRAADGPTSQALKSLLGSIGKNAGAEGITEVGQEELLIRLRDSLTEGDYAYSEQASERRLESFAAGAVAGGARGGLTSAVEQTVQSLRNGGPIARQSDQTLRERINAALDAAYESGTANAGARDMRIDDDSVLPEPQRDIDAQFNAMLGEDSAKRAMEVTEGSPYPSGYQRGGEVIAVGTANGELLTRDPQLAEDVANGRVSVREALGYAADKRLDMQRAVVARDDAGNVVHSELIGNDEDTEAALDRARRMAPNAELTSGEQVVTERADRLRAEGRIPELEGARSRLRQTEEKLADKARALEVLRAGRQDPKAIDSWKQIDTVIPRLTQQLAILTQQQRQQGQQLADLQARQDNRTDLEMQRRETEAMLRDALTAATSDDPNRGGVEVVGERTGEQRTIPPEAYTQLRAAFRERDPNLSEDEITTRIADELAARGYTVNRTDARVIPIREITQRDAERSAVRETQLDYDDPAAYRDAQRGSIAPVQTLKKSYRLGPNTATTELHGETVPLAAVRKLRRLRDKFPEDTWSLARWTKDGDQTRVEYGIQREQAFTQRLADDPVVRDVETTDSEALEQTQAGTPDGTDRVASGGEFSRGAVERVLRATEKARWKTGNKTPTRFYSFEMIDAQGRSAVYNPNIIANAGMDANQYMIDEAVPTTERKQLGFNTAMAILLERGYTPDWNTAGKYKDDDAARPSRKRRANTPRRARYEQQWESLLIGDRQQLADRAGVELSTDQLIDASLADLEARARVNERAGVSTLAELREALLQRGQAVTDAQVNQDSAAARQELAAFRELADNNDVDALYELEDRQALSDTANWVFTREHFDALLDELQADREDVMVAGNDYGQQQDERYNARQFTNRDTTGVRSLADYGDGLLLDPVLSTTLREMVADAKRAADLPGEIMVLTDQTRNEMLQSLPKALRQQVMQDPNLLPLLNGQDTGKLRGRTVFYGDQAVIWINSTMRGDQQALALAHEMGHVAFKAHHDAINADNKRRRALQNEFARAQGEGTVKQYSDPQTGYEEWFADRFAAWLHGRTENDAIARKGQFQRLYKTLRGIARRLRVTATALARAGNPALQTRIRPSQVFSDYMEGVARTAAHRRRGAELRRATFSARLQGRPDPIAEFAYRQLQAELDARTQDLKVPHELFSAISDNDPVAEIQARRVYERSVDGYSNEPSYDDYRDPAPAQTFERPPEPTPDDPAPGQRFEVPPDAAPADPAPAQVFERRPAAGGGGQGGGTPPPPPSDGTAEPGGFDKDPLHDAITGRARRWASTDAYKKVERWIRKNLGPVGEKGLRALKDLTWTDDSRLRELGPKGEKLARMFYTLAGERHREKGWFNSVEAELAHWMEEAESVLPDDRYQAEAVLAEAQGSGVTTDLSPEAQQVRKFLKRFHEQYLKRNVKGIKARDNYFPRVYDMAEIIARSDAFTGVLQQAGYKDRQAADIVHKMMEGESTVELTTNDQEGSGPGMSARLALQLTRLDDSVLRDQGFLLDPRSALMGYLRASVRRGEFERRFAGEISLTEALADMRRRRDAGQWIDDEYFASLQDRAANSPRPSEIMIHDPSAVIKKTISEMPAEDQPMARQIVQNYLGRSNSLFGVQMPPSVAKGISAVSGAMYMATLGLSTISQLTDFGAMVIRTRGAEGLGMLARAVSQVPRAERAALARAVGSISHEANLEALRLSYGNDFMTPGVRRAVDTFFKVIGLEAMTNYSRSVATQMGSEFLRMHAKEAGLGSQTSQRYLDELGVTREQVNEWAQSGYNFESEAGNAVRRALFQFTDEAILRPNAAMRPGWASNPWFTLAWQLKSFAWGFYKVVVRGLANEVVQRHREGAPVSSQVAPMALAAGVMFPLAFTVMALRDVAKEGLNAAFDDDEYEWTIDKERNAAQWTLELADRSGMLGPWSLVNSAFDAYTWGESPMLSVAGPAFEKTGQLLSGDVEKTANSLIPVAGLVR